MTKYYPGIIFPYIDDLRDNQTVVLAEHVNDLRLEVRAIEKSLGLNPFLGWNINDNYQVVDTEFSFLDLRSRLAIIEQAAMRDFDSLYVLRSGGSIINRTVNESGLGIKTRALEGVETFPALEVLKDGQDGWAGTVAERSLIRLWGNGAIDAVTLRFGNNLGQLDASAMTLGESSVTAAGSVVLPNSTMLSGSDLVRLGTTIGADDTGVRIVVGAIGSTPLTVIGVGGFSLATIHWDGSYSCGNGDGPGVVLNASGNSIQVGHHTVLGRETLSVGENFHVTQTSLTILGNPLTFLANADGIYLKDSEGGNVVELSPERVKFGLGQLSHHTLSLASSGVWAGGTPTVTLSSNTSSLTFNSSATVQAQNGLLLRLTDTSKIQLGLATSEIKAGLTLNLSAGPATATLEASGTGGSALTVGSASLSDMALRLNDYDVLYRVPGHTKLKSPPTSHLQIGIEGQHVIHGAVQDSEFGSYVKVTATGTTLTGALNLPDNVTTIWPFDQVNPNTNKYWLDTRTKSGGLSDLRPSYWDALKTAASANAPNAKTAFDFFAPASGFVKITFSGELAGNVSRSALSYQILPYNNAGVLGWVPTVPCGQPNCISFNAPAVTVEGDWYYTQLTNVFIANLEPNRKYQLQVRGQRAIPGTDASNYFSYSHNYGANYPWGRFFDVNYLRVIVEPLFTSTRVVSSVV